MEKILLIAILTLLKYQSVACYSGGVPDAACDDMYPSGHGVTAQTSTPPFRIRVSKNVYLPGETIRVTLESFGENYFRGVYIQGRPATCGRNITHKHDPIGVFTYGDIDLQTRHCFERVHSTLTHSTREKKKYRTIYWTAPVNPSGHVVLKATFVKDAHVFWVNVFSDIMRDLKDPEVPGCVSKYISPPSANYGVSSGGRISARINSASSARTLASLETLRNLDEKLILIYIVTMQLL